MKDFSTESRALRMQRFEIEDKEGWHGWCDQIPAIPMKQDWEVQILPPFMGAMARFSVRRGRSYVSIYLDVFDRLGSFDYGDEPVPHWEIWPDISGDNWRCPMADVGELVEAIEASLDRQHWDKAPSLPPMKPVENAQQAAGGVGMTDDLKLTSAGAGVYFRPTGTEEWIDLGPVGPRVSDDVPVEVRRRMPVTKIISRSDRDVTDEFDLEHGITMTVAFPTLEEARKWCGKEDT